MVRQNQIAAISQPASTHRAANRSPYIISTSPPAATFPTASRASKYAHKLDFIAEARAHFAAYPPHRAILVGDLNIAPLEHDVWSHKQLLNIVSHTPPETTGLNAWLAEGFTDALRHFVPPEEKLYTWWSYRNRDWEISNRGRRLDHVWVSHDLAPNLVSHQILKSARNWEQPSDHVPVAVTLVLGLKPAKKLFDLVRGPGQTE